MESPVPTESKELPGWLWKQVTGFAEPARGERSDDKRRAVRVPLAVRAVVWWAGPDGTAGAERSASTVVRDISPTGVGLLMAGPMREGEQFVLHVPCQGLVDKAPVALGCVAVRCDRRKEGDTVLFRIGARFTAFPGRRGRADRDQGLSNRGDPSPDEVERLRRAVLS